LHIRQSRGDRKRLADATTKKKGLGGGERRGERLTARALKSWWQEKDIGKKRTKKKKKSKTKVTDLGKKRKGTLDQPKGRHRE